jgi:Glycosyltransferase family 92
MDSSKITLILLGILTIIALYLYLKPKEVKHVNKNIPPPVKEIKQPKKYNLSIMAIFKNEQDYMEEWLNHHIKEGIDHFYLYSNDEKMENYPYLKKYMYYITLIPWIDVKNDKIGTIQRKAYANCVQKYSNETEYLLMLDIDEFIVSLSENARVVDVVNQVEDNTKAIKVQRYDFGSDGHIKKPKGNVVDNYSKHENVCSTYKTIGNTDYLDKNRKFFGVHDFPFLKKHGKVYNAYFDYKYTGFPNSCTEESVNEIPLVINHYYTKSYEEYLQRCQMWKSGGVNNIGHRKNCEKTFKKSDKNESDSYFLLSQ